MSHWDRMNCSKCGGRFHLGQLTIMQGRNDRKPNPSYHLSCYAALTSEGTRWHRGAMRQIAATAVANSKYRGVAQGILHAWFKEATPPYFDLREAATGRIVKCFYDKDDYPQIVRLLEKKTAIIQVIGMITANMVDRKIEEIKAEKFSIAEELSDADFEKFLGMAPDLTGGMTTEVYVSSVRDYNRLQRNKEA